ncbi:DUF1285 domain-containing protein [Psychrobacter sp. CAL346-MNA-CIBAN-0220]|uniref:DUF1285 domain-containing protein n=1 Tax=Psychrobacter sp. CAL346-MNA-CIBAN-0220 TaxID=3140457 RepID=UPI00331B605E
MTDNNNSKVIDPSASISKSTESKQEMTPELEPNHNNDQDLNSIDALGQYLKSSAGTRQGRAIPPLEKWHPEQTTDMDLIIKANGEWWHEGRQMTRESLVNLFATILWAEENNGIIEYFLKTPVQKLRIEVEDVPLLINDVGIIIENEVSWLEFTTTTGDVVRLDEAHSIELHSYQPRNDNEIKSETQVRPYMLVRNGLTALIGRNTFYHLAEIGELTEQEGETILTLQSGGQSYSLSMPNS